MADPEVERATRFFMTAARKVNAFIHALRQGERDDYQQQETEIYRSIDRLEDRANRPEVRATDTGEAFIEEARRLRRLFIDAKETGYHARVARRNGEISRLHQEERESRSAHRTEAARIGVDPAYLPRRNRAGSRQHSQGKDRLFIGSYPEGLVYADRGRTSDGDYARVGFLSFNTLEFEPAQGADKTLVAEARKHAASIQARRGEEYQVSTCGQTRILGQDRRERTGRR